MSTTCLKGVRPIESLLDVYPTLAPRESKLRALLRDLFKFGMGKLEYRFEGDAGSVSFTALCFEVAST